MFLETSGLGVETTALCGGVEEGLVAGGDGGGGGRGVLVGEGWKGGEGRGGEGRGGEGRGGEGGEVRGGEGNIWTCNARVTLRGSTQQLLICFF